jgi:tetratricopeptide (TPR) repeat protein
MVVGEVHGWNNDFEAAHAAFREALWMAERAGDDPTAVRALIMLVLVVGNHLERFEEADMLVEHARARLDRLLPGPRWSADLEHYAGLVRYAAEDYQGAIAAYRRALALRESLGTDHPDVAETHLSLGAAYLSQERFTPAQSHLEQALATYREAFGATHPVVGHCLGNLGYLAKAQDQHERALELQQQALSIHRAAVGDVHNWIGRSMLNLGDTLAALGRPTEARLHWEEAAEIHEQLGLATRAAESWTRIATQAEGEGKPDDAREAWERARQILTGLEDASVQQGEVAFALAQLLWPTNPVQATALASEASAAFETAGDPLRARAVTTWLSQR